MTPQTTEQMLQQMQERQKEIKEMQERQKKQEAELKRLQKQNAASNDLSGFQSAVMARAESWMIAARDIGSAYKKAAEEHKKALDAQSASDALSNQILFSILAVATPAALAWVSSVAQRRTGTAWAAAQHRLTIAKKDVDLAQKLPSGAKWRETELWLAQERVRNLENMPKPASMIVDAITDTLKGSAGEGLSSVGPLLRAEKLVEASENPQVFQNDLENNISKVKILAFRAFSAIRDDWKKAPPESWDTYDLTPKAKAHTEWEQEAKNLAGHEELLSVSDMAHELERGFWKKYVLENHSHRDFGLFKTDESYDFVGYHVVKRLEKLGVTQPLGILTVLPGTREEIPEGMMDPALIGPNEEMYVDRLVNWAKIYQVKPLLKDTSGKAAFARAPVTSITGSVRK